MGVFYSTKPSFLQSLTLTLVLVFTTFVSSKSAPDYTTVLYKGCANQTFSDQAGLYSQTLSGLFSSLISQSSKTKFFKTSAGGGQVSFTGLFQCRGDLSNGDCYSCVSRLPKVLDTMCGKTIAARVQLTGCYMLYELANFPQISGVQMLYKTCGRSQASGVGFEERRDTAFASLADGIVNQNGFYATQYQSVYVLAQCEGDLSMNDCGECVKTVVQKSQVECGSSISGQIYLNKCYMTYTYYPNGISKKSASDGAGGGGGGGGGGGSAQNTGKTIAIVVGGAAGVGFLVICLMFARSLLKKHDDDY